MFVGPSYQLDSRKASSQRTVNLFLVGMEAEGKSSYMLEQVPGLITRLSIGSSIPCRGAFEADNRCFAIFGATLYEIFSDYTSAARGTLLTSSGLVSMDYGLTQLVMVDGANGYVLTLSTNVFARITDSDFPGADTVSFISGYFKFTRDRDGQQFNWSAIDNAASVDALDFASDEYLPDDIVTHASLFNETWIVGEKSSAVYYISTPDVVFARDNGSIMEVGGLACKSLVKVDSSLMMLGRDKNGAGMVYRSQGRNWIRVSTQAVEEALSESSDMTAASAYSYQQNGRTFYCLNAPGLTSTWCYEIKTGAWHERCDQDAFGQYKAGRITHHVYCFSKHLGFGSDGVVYEMDHSTYLNGSDEMVCERTSPNAAAPALDYVSYPSFVLDATTGLAASGEPSVELSWSNDGGMTFGDPVTKSLGALGNYFARLTWHRLGRARDRVWRVKFSGNAKFSIINAGPR